MSLSFDVPHAAELWAQASYDDALVFLMIALAVGSYYISKHLSTPIDIPERFWYEVPQRSSEQTAAREKIAQSRNIARAFREQDLQLVIFWGSQSGRAEVLAKRMASSVEKRFGLRTLVADLNDHDHDHLSELLPSDLCVFILSTYGDGDPPDNSNGFWEAVSAMHEGKVDLGSLRYVVFGLGNSKYRQYNRVAKKVDLIFQERGATRFGDAGCGDDASGTTEDDFLMWRQSIEEELKTQLQLTEQSRDYQPVFDVREVLSADDAVYLGEPHSSMIGQQLGGRLAFDADLPSIISVANIKKLWESGRRLCLHVDFGLAANRFVKYKSGDHLAIWPSNPEHEVEKLLSILNLENKRDNTISITCADDRMKVSIPTPTTIEALVRYYLQICGRLSRETLFALTAFAPSATAKGELERISNTASTFKAEVVDQKLTLADLLTGLSGGVKWIVPESFLVERLSTMQPRYYSICSSAAVEPRTISITVVVEKPLKPVQRGCWGLATSYLHALEQHMNRSGFTDSALGFALDGPRTSLSGNHVYGRVRPSKFKPPFKASTPIIMIGCGTGVAPFRAFVQERVRRKAIGHETGKALLFVGFRRPDEDFIYAKEWREAQAALGRDNLKLYPAFSREDPSRRVYVQDRLREHANEVLDLFETDFQTRMYICGSAEMSRDVASTLAEIRQDAKGESLEQANEWVKRLRQMKLLLEDVWS